MVKPFLKELSSRLSVLSGSCPPGLLKNPTETKLDKDLFLVLLLLLLLLLLSPSPSKFPFAPESESVLRLYA